MNVIIRKAVIKDAQKIAQVHVKSWRETYIGIVPDNYLQNLSIESRKQMWKRILSENNPLKFTFVCEIDGEVVGFINGGETREKNSNFDSEVYAIYLLKLYQRQGIGKLLVQTLLESFINVGFKSMFLWVLQENDTLNFYKKLGGVVYKSKEEEIGGKVLIENLIGWYDIQQIVV